MKHRKSVSLLSILLFACGSGSYADSGNPDELKQKISLLANEIHLLIGQASCTSDDQCAAVAMGNKSCGGPAFYLPYSKLNTDTKNVLSLAKEHRELSQKYNHLLGLMSDCAMVTEPPVACTNDKCQIQQ